MLSRRKKDENYKIPDEVMSIGSYTFRGCASLTSITIPNSVTSIGNSAFSGCKSLTSITIPNNVTSIGWDAFSGCRSLTSITIPNSLTSIGSYAFNDCTSLESITIPDSVTSIGGYAFSYCRSLTSITIPDSVASIGSHAFNDCTSLESITILDSVTSIGDWAFENCTSLTSVTIPNSVTSIGESAFRYCTSLISVTIPNSVTSIGESAFRYCTSLTSITIPDNVMSIGRYAFMDCTNLTTINVATKNQNYISVNGVLYNKDKTAILYYPAGKKDKSYTIIDGVISIDGCAFENCISLTDITIPNSVTSIGGSAFSGCTSLTSITIPSSVTSISSSAFEDCTSLVSITIPHSVTEIGYDAFRDCTSLVSITIPDSVKSIGGRTFNGCTSLTSITILGSVTSIGDWAFGDCTSLTAINVAAGNKNYVSVNGVLYNKDKTTLICYPAGKKDKNYKILDGVTWIDSSAFRDCTSLTSVTIPDSVTSIDRWAFRSCISLTTINVVTENQNYVSVNGVLYNKDKTELICYPAGKKDNNYKIPDGVTRADWGTFENCTSLVSITIPDSVMSIGSDAFRGCTNLTVINVATGNKNYVSVSGVLYNKDVTTIICYPAGKKDKNYKILDDVTIIDHYAFSGCTSLTSITMPNSVTGIFEYAFDDCTSLKNITIPDSVTAIFNWAFGYYYDNGCKKIDNFKIYCYSGTEGEKYAIDNGFDYVLLDKLPTLSKVTGAKLAGRAADALRINWTKNANADGYIVEMYQNGKWERVAKITNSNTTTYRKAGLKAGTVYNFRVKAYKMYGSTAIYSEYSATVTARTNPSVMTGAKLGGRAADALRINWTKNASADGYIVEMYQGNEWVRVAKITSNSTTTFRKAGLKASTVYKFRVKAYKMSGSTALYGDYSATVTAMTNPSVMAGAKLGGRAADALRINWSKNASADGYIVEMYQGNKWVRVAKITSNNTTTFKKSGLKASSVYKFRVSAYKMSGKTALYGNYSATVTARTNPSIVKGVKIGGKAKDALRVNWTKNASAQGYIVEMYKGGKWVRVAKITNGNTTTYRKAGLAKNTTYKFRVCAYYMSGKTALYGNYGSVSGKTAAK